MEIFTSGTPEFEVALDGLCRRIEDPDLAEVEGKVRRVLSEVRNRGDAALLDYTRLWDGVSLGPDQIEVPPYSLQQALQSLDPVSRDCLAFAASRIRAFHEHQRPSSWEYVDEEGNLLGQRVTALARVGVYVPGGLGAYPSTVLMNVIPARVAGVQEIFLVTPPSAVRSAPIVLAAACVAGVDRVFQVGGAQAVAALAYGTETIPAVDKIVGPGNVFVATAKKLVFGQVDIDMMAGPSEVLVLTDGTEESTLLAADLLAQAEHDERAVPILVATSTACVNMVVSALEAMIGRGPWSRVAGASLAKNGKAFVVRDLDEAARIANRIAPEHLELAVRDPEALLPKIRNAGAIFLGSRSAEALGDYVAGPNHVLPTMGTARFFSPLGVYDFVKWSSVLRISSQGLSALGPKAAHLARMEGFHGHAHAIEVRGAEADGPGVII